MKKLLKYILVMLSLLIGMQTNAVIRMYSNNGLFRLLIMKHRGSDSHDSISIFRTQSGVIDLLNPVIMIRPCHNSDGITAAYIDDNGYYAIGTQQGNIEVYQINNEILIDSRQLPGQILAIDVNDNKVDVCYRSNDGKKLVNNYYLKKNKIAKIQELPDERKSTIDQGNKQSSNSKKQTEQKKTPRIKKSSLSWYTSFLNSCKKFITNKYFYIGSAVITGYLMYKWMRK